MVAPSNVARRPTLPNAAALANGIRAEVRSRIAAALEHDPRTRRLSILADELEVVQQYLRLPLAGDDDSVEARVDHLRELGITSVCYSMEESEAYCGAVTPEMGILASYRLVYVPPTAMRQIYGIDVKINT